MPLSRDEFDKRFDRVFDFLESLVRDPGQLEGIPSIVKLFEESEPGGTVLYYSTIQSPTETELAAHYPQHPLDVDLAGFVYKVGALFTPGRHFKVTGAVPVSSGSGNTIEAWGLITGEAFVEAFVRESGAEGVHESNFASG